MKSAKRLRQWLSIQILSVPTCRYCCKGHGMTCPIQVQKSAITSPMTVPLLARQFMTLVQQVVIEFDALGTTLAAQNLYAELNTIRLPMDPTGQETTPAGDLIAEVSRIVLERDGSDQFPLPTFPMPYYLACAQRQSGAASGISDSIGDGNAVSGPTPRRRQI